MGEISLTFDCGDHHFQFQLETETHSHELSSRVVAIKHSWTLSTDLT